MPRTLDEAATVVEVALPNGSRIRVPVNDLRAIRVVVKSAGPTPRTKRARGTVMLTTLGSANVLLGVQHVDPRKGFDGLGALVESVFQRNVFDGHLFLFVNKRRDRLTALWWNQDGLVIWYKRLGRPCFELPRNAAARISLIPRRWSHPISHAGRTEQLHSPKQTGRCKCWP